jgi:hypothetical protein
MSRKSRKNPKTMPVVSPNKHIGSKFDDFVDEDKEIDYEIPTLKAEQEKIDLRRTPTQVSTPFYDDFTESRTPKHEPKQYTMADIGHLERRIDALTAQTCMCIRSNEPRYTLDEFLAMPVETFLNAEWFAALLKKAIAQVERENHGE